MQNICTMEVGKWSRVVVVGAWNWTNNLFWSLDPLLSSFFPTLPDRWLTSRDFPILPWNTDSRRSKENGKELVGVEDLLIKQTALVQLCLHLKEICFWMRGDSVIVFLLRTHLRQRKVTRIFRNYSRHSIELAPTPLSEPWQPLSWLFAQNCDDTISRWEKNVWLVTNTMAPTLNMFSSFDTLWKRKRQQACLS